MKTSIWEIAILIISAGFLVLVTSLIPTIVQLRLLLKDLMLTSSKLRDLTIQLKSLSAKVDNDVEKFDQVLDTTKETMGTVKESFKFINKNILKQSAGFLALIPAIKFGWNLIKKLKRR